METQTIERVEKQVGSLQVQASEVRITSQPTYDRCVELLQTVKSMQADDGIKELEEAKSAAHEAHLKITALWHRVVDPLKAMETLLKLKIMAWDRQKEAEERERQRKIEEDRQKAIRAEEDRLDREAKAKAAQAAKEAAEKARRDGESKKAQEQARKQAEADTLAQTAQENSEKIATMEATPAAQAKPAYERSSSVQTRDNWSWEFDGTAIDAVTRKPVIIKPETFNQAFLALVRHVAQHPSYIFLLEPEKLVQSHPNLNDAAGRQKTLCQIPGGHAVNKGVVSAKA